MPELERDLATEAVTVPYVTCPSCSLPTYAGRQTHEECPRCGTPLRPDPGAPAHAPGAPEGLESDLELARLELGMDLAFLSEITDGREVVRAVAGPGRRFGVGRGTTHPHEDTFCRRLLEGRIGNVVHDARQDVEVRDLDGVRSGGIGAYIGVPLRTDDARLYMLCCLAREARPALGEIDVHFLLGLGETVITRLGPGETPPPPRARRGEDLLRGPGASALLEALLDGLPLAMAVLDDELRFVAVNRRLAALDGVEVDAHVGRRPQETLATLAPDLLEDLRAVLRGGEPVVGREVSATAPDAPDEARTWSVHLLPVRGEPGAVTGVCMIVDDITGERAAEHTLVARARRQAEVTGLGLRALAGDSLASLLDAAAALVARSLGTEFATVYELLPSGRLLLRAGVGWREGRVGLVTVPAGSGSPAGFTLVSREPVVVEDLRRERRFRPSTLLVEHEVTSAMTVIIQTRTGSFGVLGVDTTSRRTFTPDDLNFVQTVANVLATAVERVRMDEERQRLEREVLETEALRQSDLVKTSLLRAVSHDLRSPLTAISTAAQALLELDLDAEGRHAFALDIQAESTRLARLVDNLLDFTRLQAGVAPPRGGSASLEEVVHAALDALPGGGRDVVVAIAPDLPAVGADPAQLERALGNLLENALRFARAAPVSVEAERRGDRLRVWVSDDGPGIPEADRERIFEPFVQTGRPGPGGGNGLGLAIARGFVEASGGRVWAEPSTRGGARFVVELPMGDEERDRGLAPAPRGAEGTA